MSGCDWQKEKFSVSGLRGKDYDRVFGKSKWQKIKQVLETVLIHLVVACTGSELKQNKRTK